MLIKLNVNMVWVKHTEMNMYELLPFELFRMININQIGYSEFLRCFEVFLDRYQLVDD
jgi:hypothetical protein